MREPIPFKRLALSQRFVFASELEFPHTGAARGPWVRISARQYCHVSKVGTLHAHTVGSVYTLVIPQEEGIS